MTQAMPPTPRQIPWAIRILSKVRPAPLSAFLGTITGVRKRRVWADQSGNRFFLDPLTHLGKALMFAGGYEPGVCAVLRAYLRPGSVFVDVGANEGYFSVLASRLVGAEGRVYAVEPQTRLGPLLAKNVELNGAGNVSIVQAALGGKPGTAEIYLTHISTGSSSFYRPTRYWLPKQQTRVLTLEDFLAQSRIAACDLMKIDVEGAEYDILMNAGKVLSSGRIRTIILDIHDAALERIGFKGSDLHELMLRSGYRLNWEFGPRVYVQAER